MEYLFNFKFGEFKYIFDYENTVGEWEIFTA